MGCLGERRQDDKGRDQIRKQQEQEKYEEGRSKGALACKQEAEQFVWQDIMFDGYRLFYFLVKSYF